MAAVKAADLDSEFIKRAQKVTSFNLSPSDFTSLKYKSEIQWLFKTHFFSKKFNLSNTIKGQPSVNELNKLIKGLKAENLSNFNALHSYNLKGVGPGEATLFFLLDDAHLGGGASAGLDIVIGSTGYEVKAGDYSRPKGQNDYYFKNFKLGGTVPMDRMVKVGFELRDSDPKIKAAGTEKNGVNAKQIEMILSQPELAARWKKEVEEPYRKAAHKYLTKNPLLCIINTTPKERKGEVHYIGKPKMNEVFVDVITQGTIKPMLKI